MLEFASFVVIYDSKQGVFGFLTADWTKEANQKHHFGLWEIVISICHVFSHNIID